MEVWSHGGALFEVDSYYALPTDAWHYELTELGRSTTGLCLRVVVPDATPEGPFTPRADADVSVHVDVPGRVPWPILRRFVELVEASGDTAARRSTGGTA